MARCTEQTKWPRHSFIDGTCAYCGKAKNENKRPKEKIKGRRMIVGRDAVKNAGHEMLALLERLECNVSPRTPNRMKLVIETIEEMRGFLFRIVGTNESVDDGELVGGPVATEVVHADGNGG